MQSTVSCLYKYVVTGKTLRTLVLKGHGLEHLPILMHIVLCGKRFRCACCLHRSILCKCTTGCEIQHLLTITDRNGWFLRNTCYTYIYIIIYYIHTCIIYIYICIYIYDVFIDVGCHICFPCISSTRTCHRSIVGCREAIFGSRAGRTGAELKVMAAIEAKLPPLGGWMGTAVFYGRKLGSMVNEC